MALHTPLCDLLKVEHPIMLAGMVMQAMTELGEFTQEDLASRIASMTGMDPTQADTYAEHVISQFLGGKVEAMGPDRYRINAETNKTAADHVQDLKNMIKNAGIDGKPQNGVEEQVTQPQTATQPQQAQTANGSQTSSAAGSQTTTSVQPEQKAQQDQLITRLNKAVDSLDMTQASPDTIQKKIGTIHDDAAHRAMSLQDLAKVTDQFEKIAKDEQAAKQAQGTVKTQITPQQQAQAAQQASTFESELSKVIKRAGI